MKILRAIRDRVIKKLRLSALREKVFYGTYADNRIAIDKFVADNNVIPVRIEDDKLKFMAIKPETDSLTAENELIKEQAKIHARKLRKKHKLTLYYVEDNAFNKLMGWKRGFESTQLS